jgi:hypothetical protein
MKDYLFDYVKPEFEDRPEKEEPDPALAGDISEGYRKSKKNLFLFNGFIVVWAMAIFTLRTPEYTLFGLRFDFQISAIPFLLFVGQFFFIYRTIIEFCLNLRSVRRRKIVQVDFVISFYLTLISTLALSAGFLNTSIISVFKFYGVFLGAIILSWVFIIPLMFLLMYIRLKVRIKKALNSVANAAIEAMAWSIGFSSLLSIIVVIALSIILFNYPNVSKYIWNQQVDMVQYVFSIFLFVAVLSIYFIRHGIFSFVFSPESDYFTSYSEDGSKIIHLRGTPKHPIL